MAFKIDNKSKEAHFEKGKCFTCEFQFYTPYQIGASKPSLQRNWNKIVVKDLNAYFFEEFCYTNQRGPPYC